MTISQAAASDIFFYHDTVDIGTEIEADIFLGLLQPKGCLFYNRSYGCDLAMMENRPNALTMLVVVPFDVVQFVGVRNGRVSDGGSGLPDRRVATTQDRVVVEVEGQETDVSIDYVELRSLTEVKNIRTPVGVQG